MSHLRPFSLWTRIKPVRSSPILCYGPCYKVALLLCLFLPQSLKSEPSLWSYHHRHHHHHHAPPKTISAFHQRCQQQQPKFLSFHWKKKTLKSLSQSFTIRKDHAQVAQLRSWSLLQNSVCLVCWSWHVVASHSVGMPVCSSLLFIQSIGRVGVPPLLACGLPKLSVVSGCGWFYWVPCVCAALPDIAAEISNQEVYEQVLIDWLIENFI